MPIARRAIIGEGVQAGGARQVTGLEDNRAVPRIANQVMADGGHNAKTIRPAVSANCPIRIGGKEGVLHGDSSGPKGAEGAEVNTDGIARNGTVGEGQGPSVGNGAARIAHHVTGQGAGADGDRTGASIKDPALDLGGITH
jgi:hypothetical protein